MDDKNNLNNAENMPSGFDFVSNIENTQNSADISNEEIKNSQHEQPIENNALELPTKNEKPKAETIAKDFIPNGTYSYSAAKGNLPDSAVNEPVNTQPYDFKPDFSEGSSVDTYNISHQHDTTALHQHKVYKKPKKSKGKKHGTGVLVLSAILSLILGLGGGILGSYFALKNINFNDSEGTQAIEQKITTIKVEDTANSITEAVAKKAGPSVIGIRTTAAVTNFFFGTSEATEEGSGIIYTSDGYIITNYHVIESAVKSSNSKVEVFLPENTDKSYEAEVIGYNISSDLAVVKINAQNLSAIEFADSKNITVGQSVIAIGNPGGLEFIGSVSTGVISGLNRSITVGTGATMSLIQTDAAINPGNSGGALVNSNGELIGVNSVKLVSEGYEGMGFAIPSNTVKEICDKIISRQNEPVPYIGIQISQNYTAAQLKQLGYPTGAVVVSIVADGPADEAGIERGDIITEFNGKAIENYTALDDAIADCKPGSSVTVKLYRAGKFYSTSIKIEANNAQ